LIDPHKQREIVEKSRSQQRPKPPSACDNAIEPGRAAQNQREDHDEEQLARDLQRHCPGEQRHNDVAGQIRQRRPAHLVKFIAAGSEDRKPREMVRIIEERRQYGREQRDAVQRQQRGARQQHAMRA